MRRAEPTWPAALAPAEAKSPRTTGSDEIEEVIEEHDDEFVPEELDEDAEADLSMPADSDFDKSFQGKSGSGDSVF